MCYFDWDENKARINQQKHGITFEEASTVFLTTEPSCLMIPYILSMKTDSCCWE